MMDMRNYKNPSDETDEVCKIFIANYNKHDHNCNHNNNNHNSDVCI